MTILEYSSASRIGGAETYLFRLIAAAEAAGHRVITITRQGSALDAELRRRGHDARGLHRGGFNPLTSLRVAALMRREKVDVVHTHLFSAHSSGARVARWMKVPSVAHVHAIGETVDHIRNSTRIVAVAGAVRDEVVQAGIPSEKVSVVPVGVDIENWEQLPDPAAARRELGLPAGARVVSVVASLTPRKGHRYLVRAAATLAEKATPNQPPIHLVFAGEGSEKSALEELARELKIADRTHLLGFCDAPKLRTLMAATDVAALPSSREGLSVSIMEAMSAGRCVLATNIAGMPELVEDGRSGLLVPPEDEAALRTALESVLWDDHRRQTLAAAGRERVRKDFDGKRCLADMISFLERTAQGER